MMSMTEREKYRIAVEVLEKEQEPYSQKASELISKKYSTGLTREEQELLTMVDKTNQQYHKIIADLRCVAGLNTMNETPEEARRADEEAHASTSEWLAAYEDQSKPLSSLLMLKLDSGDAQGRPTGKLMTVAKYNGIV